MRLNFLYITTVYGVDFLLWNLKCKKKRKNKLQGFFCLAFIYSQLFLLNNEIVYKKTFSFFGFTQEMK